MHFQRQNYTQNTFILNFNNSTRQNAKQNCNPSACLEVGI